MHIIPILVLLGIGILFLPGWLVCCICSCADCCCCCCCKKSSCKLPFYIVTSIFYAFGLAVYFYGLSQTVNVFEGLGDTECSLLKFINDVLNGENGDKTPKWGGINTIQGLLRSTKYTLEGISDTDDLNHGKTNFQYAKRDFLLNLQTYSDNVYNDKNISEENDYKKVINSKDYYLDITKDFGKFTSTPEFATPGSFVFKWYNEFKTIASKSEEKMDGATTDFGQLIDKKGSITSKLDEGTNEIEKIKTSFNKVKNQISGVITDYSDTIDEYGNIGYKAVFSIFLAIDALIAAFISLRMFCKFPACQNGCLNCLLKSAIHILWNILALMTFLTLILGSVLTLVGTVGNDLISVVSFLVSDENLKKEDGNSNDDAILLGDAAKYLTHCINGDGNLKGELGFEGKGSGFDNLEELKTAENTIDSLITNFTEVGQRRLAYEEYKNKFDKIKNYQTDDFKLIKLDASNNIEESLSFKDYIENLNSDVSSQHDTWSISCSGNNNRKPSCQDTKPSDDLQNCIEFSTCTSKNLNDWYGSTLSENLNVKVINAFIESIQTASKKTNNLENDLNNDADLSPTTKSIENILIILNKKYDQFIESQITNLRVFKTKINSLTHTINDFTGEEGGFFDIVDCKFIGNNIKIILNSLKNSLGGSIKTVGITLTATGLGMCFSISFTILLNIILNTKEPVNPQPDKFENPNVNIVNQYDYMNQQNLNANNGNAFNTNGNFNEGLRVIDYNNGI